MRHNVDFFIMCVAILEIALTFRGAALTRGGLSVAECAWTERCVQFGMLAEYIQEVEVCSESIVFTRVV